MAVAFPRVDRLRQSLAEALAEELPDWTVWDGVQGGIPRFPALILMESETVMGEGHDRPPFFNWSTRMQFYVVGGPEGRPGAWQELGSLLARAGEAIMRAVGRAVPSAALIQMGLQIPGETIPLAGSSYHLALIEIRVAHTL